MLTFSILAYLSITLLIGFWASRKIHNSEDYILAGKNLPAFMVGVTIFSTWFGSEMIMGVPSIVIKEGIKGLIVDAGGSILCLSLISFFFTKPIYQLNIYTINDFFRLRFGKKMETITSLIIIFSYFSWVASQFLALAFIFHSLFGISNTMGLIIGASIVLIYTYIGGMWAVSITDLIQAVVITLGLIIILYQLLNQSESPRNIFRATPRGFFNFFPEKGFYNWTDYIYKWVAFGIGAIVSQEIYQRVLAARSMKSAKRGVFLGGFLMVIIGVLPSFAGLIIFQIHPELILLNDGQNLLPEMVSKYMRMPIQILFFGALISAILSTSSGAILAPATVLSENIIKPFSVNFTDKNLLFSTRLSVVFMTVISCAYAIFNTSIHDLVVNSVALITTCMTAPFVLGIYWKKTSVTGAWAGVIAGFIAWLIPHLFQSKVEPVLIGTLFSTLAVFLVSFYKKDNSDEVFRQNIELISK